MPSLATPASVQPAQASASLDLLDLGSPTPAKGDTFGDFSRAKPGDDFGDFLSAGQQGASQGAVQKPVLGLVQGGVQPNLSNGQGAWPVAQSGQVSMGLPVGPAFAQPQSNTPVGGMSGQNNLSMGAQPQPAGWTMGQGHAPFQGQMGQMMGGSPPVYNQMAMGFPMTQISAPMQQQQPVGYNALFNSSPWPASGGPGMGPGLAPQMGAYAANNPGMQSAGQAC